MASAQTLVCIPVTDDDLRTLQTSGILPGTRQAFTANPSLREGFGLSDNTKDDEEAEYAAFLIAGLWGLSKFGQRCIVIAHLPHAAIQPGEEPGNGGVRVSDVAARDVDAFFTEDMASPPELSSNSDLDTLWARDDVQQFLGETSMLWHDVSELDR